jgi:glycosyltransferase involved in cell wall biosynthesis
MEPVPRDDEKTAPRLSIVMPCFNHDRYLAEALGAIVSQSRRPDQIILVDDGSASDNWRAVQSIVSNIPGIEVIRHPENRGVLEACKSGFAAVTGDFVAFMAADDRISAGLIEQSYNAIALNPRTGLIFPDIAIMSEDGSSLQVMPLQLAPEPRYFSPVEFQRKLQRSFFFPGIGASWFNTELLRARGGFDPRLRWHTDLYAAFAAGVLHGATYVPGVHSCYRQVPDSYSSNRTGPEQAPVLRAWLAKTREPSETAVRRAFRAAAVLPDYGVAAIKALPSDPGYLTVRLAAGP